MIRDNLPLKRPREHYNSRGKTKQTFNNIKEALKFIYKLNLLEYIVYKCKICNKYHIGKKKKEN